MAMAYAEKRMINEAAAAMRELAESVRLLEERVAQLEAKPRRGRPPKQRDEPLGMEAFRGREP